MVGGVAGKSCKYGVTRSMDELDGFYSEGSVIDVGLVWQVSTSSVLLEV